MNRVGSGGQNDADQDLQGDREALRGEQLQGEIHRPEEVRTAILSIPLQRTRLLPLRLSGGCGDSERGEDVMKQLEMEEEREEKKERCYCSPFDDLIDDDWQYCPYCGVRLE